VTAARQDRYGIGHGYAMRIAETVEALRHWASGLDADLVHGRPPDGEWAVAENLVHVVEFLPYWADRLPEVVARPGAPFGRTHEDPARIAWIEEHRHDPLGDVLPALTRAADRACRQLCAVPEDAWELTGRHRRGEMTLREIVEFFLVEHLDDHFRQARAAWRAVNGAAPARR
jgi:uncharacterized damage-inducible protein DinB